VPAYLATGYRLLPGLLRRWAERISTVHHVGEPEAILDLYSGAEGPTPSIIEEVEKSGYQVRVRLTDLYPNQRTSSDPSVVWPAESMDATRVSPELAGVRTMFSRFTTFGRMPPRRY
jgi:hypothetical protein